MEFLGAAVMGVGSLFASGAVASMIGGVIVGALVGAAIGGLTAAITGGSIGKGILFGAIGGAVLGGISGYVSYTAPTNLQVPTSNVTGNVGGVNTYGSGPGSISTFNTPPPAEVSWADKFLAAGTGQSGGGLSGALVNTAGNMIMGATSDASEVAQEEGQLNRDAAYEQAKLQADTTLSVADKNSATSRYNTETSLLNSREQREAENKIKQDELDLLAKEKQDRTNSILGSSVASSGNTNPSGFTSINDSTMRDAENNYGVLSRA
jgi:hypothetical protein